MEEARRLVEYIRSLPDFRIADLKGVYDPDHMGAVITEAVLQAGVKYETVVLPRVMQVREILGAERVSGFVETLQNSGPEAVLQWQGKKVQTVVELAKLLSESGVESAADLRAWIASPENVEKLLAIKGIGPKTVDYLKILVGEDTVAIDRHLLAFLKEAGIKVRDYQHAHRIVSGAADLMEMVKAQLDLSIWERMSGGASALGAAVGVGGRLARMPLAPAGAGAAAVLALGIAAWGRRRNGPEAG